MNDPHRTDEKATNLPGGQRPATPTDVPGRPALQTATAGRDPVTGTDTRDYPDATDLADHDPDALEQEVRRTRADISGTIDQIEARLSPSHLKHEAMSAVHQTIDQVQDRLDPRHLVNNAKRSMIDTIRDNPVPSIIAGLSLGYLIFSGSDDDKERRHYQRTYGYASGYPAAGYRTGAQYRTRYAEPYPQGPTMRSGVAYQQGSGSSGEDLRARAQHAADDAKQKAGDAADQARAKAEGVADQAQHLAHDAQQQMYRAKSGLEHFVEDNPLAAGALAAGLGALLGGLIPTTPQEDRLMGEASDALKERAKHAAEDTLEQAKHAAEAVASDAKDEAQKAQGSPGDKAKQVVDRMTDTAKSEAENVKQEAQSDVKKVGDEAKSQADSAGGAIKKEVSSI